MGEPWVQGLVEGEYADLSVEERLNALVALVTVVNEGNAIRVALEVRIGSLLSEMQVPLIVQHLSFEEFSVPRSLQILGSTALCMISSFQCLDLVAV